MALQFVEISNRDIRTELDAHRAISGVTRAEQIFRELSEKCSAGAQAK